MPANRTGALRCGATADRGCPSQAAIIWILAGFTLFAAIVIGVGQKRRAEKAKARGERSEIAETPHEWSENEKAAAGRSAQAR